MCLVQTLLLTASLQRALEHGGVCLGLKQLSEAPGPSNHLEKRHCDLVLWEIKVLLPAAVSSSRQFQGLQEVAAPILFLAILGHVEMFWILMNQFIHPGLLVEGGFLKPEKDNLEGL